MYWLLVVTVVGVVWIILFSLSCFLRKKSDTIVLSFSLCGSGHSTRARQLLPELRNFGKVMVIVSGKNEQSPSQDFSEDLEVKGFTFVYGKKNNIDLWATVRKAEKLRFLLDVWRLFWLFQRIKPKVLVNDFEPVSAWAAYCSNVLAWIAPRIVTGVPTVHFGHQPALLSHKVPYPRALSYWKGWLYQWGLRILIPGGRLLAFHYDSCGESWIHLPLISRDIREKTPTKGAHFLVYLPAIKDIDYLLENLLKLDGVKFVVFGPKVQEGRSQGNVSFCSFSREGFADYLASAIGVITSGGFQTTAEALYLGKPLCVFPQANQHEQLINAATLRMLGHLVIEQPLEQAHLELKQWIEQKLVEAPGIPRSYEFEGRLRQIVLQEIFIEESLRKAA